MEQLLSSPLFLADVAVAGLFPTWLVSILVTAVSVLIIAFVLPGIEVKGFTAALIFAAALALLNATVGKVLGFFSAPFNWITFGLFSFVVSAVVIKVADYFVSGIKVKNFWWALIMAVLLGIVNSVLNSILGIS